MLKLLKIKRNKVIASLAFALVIILLSTLALYLNTVSNKTSTIIDNSDLRVYSNEILGVTEGEKVHKPLKINFDADPQITQKVDFYINNSFVSSSDQSPFPMIKGDSENDIGSYSSLSFREGSQSISATLTKKDGRTLSKTVNFIVDNSSIMLPGLNASYFLTKDFSGPEQTQIDPNIDFDWQKTKEDNSSIRWEGYIAPKYSEKYTFTTVSDDGIRVWINGELVIDNWTVHPESANSSPVYLEKDRFFDIKVEYFEEKTFAVAKLYWSSESQEKEIVPASAFFHEK